MFRRPGSVPPQTRPVPGEPRRRPAAGRGSGTAPARRAPRGAADLHEHARRTGRRRRCRGRRAGRRGSARHPPPGRPAPPRASAAPPWAGRPPAPGSRRSPPALYGSFARSRGSGRSAGYSCGTTRRPMNRRFVRSVRRATPDRPGAHRVNRSATDGCSTHLRHQVQAQRRCVVGELPRGPQQVLRPLPPRRRRLRDHVPCERRRLRRHRRRPHRPI